MLWCKIQQVLNTFRKQRSLTFTRLSSNAASLIPFISPVQRFSTSVPQDFPKQTISDYLLRATDLFSLGLSNEKNNSQHNSYLV